MKMLNIKKFWLFNLSLIKESILYVILFLNVIGILLFYLSDLQIPIWILWVLPIIALYLASYKMYSRYFGDLEIKSADSNEFRVKSLSVGGEWPEMFEKVVDAYFINKGSSKISIDSIKIKYGFNSIIDDYIIEKVGLTARISRIANPDKFNKLRPREPESEYKLPIIIEREDILPFKINIELYSESYSEEALMKNLNWINTINLIFVCTYTTLSQTNEKAFQVDIDASNLKETAINYKKSIS